MLFLFIFKYQANINIFGIPYFVVKFGIYCWLIVAIHASELYQAFCNHHLHLSGVIPNEFLTSIILEETQRSQVRRKKILMKSLFVSIKLTNITKFVSRCLAQDTKEIVQSVILPKWRNPPRGRVSLLE